MNLPKLNISNYFSHFQDFILTPFKALKGDRLKALFLTIVIGVLSLGVVPGLLFLRKVYHKRSEDKTDQDQKVSEKAQEVLSIKENEPLKKAEKSTHKIDKKPEPSLTQEESLLEKKPQIVQQAESLIEAIESFPIQDESTIESKEDSSDEKLDTFKRKRMHYRTCSLDEYFKKYAKIPEDRVDFLAQVENHLQLENPKEQDQDLPVTENIQKLSIVKRPRFRKVANPLVETEVQQIPPAPPSLRRTVSTIQALTKRSVDISKKKKVVQLLKKNDPLLSKYTLEKIYLLIKDHTNHWKKEKVDAAICFPLTVDVFVDIYYCAENGNILIATQKFDSGMFNEIVRAYDWKTGQEVVCKRRIPLEGNVESLKESSKKSYAINRKINEMNLPNIIEIKGFLELENQAITVLEKMEGCELQDILEDKMSSLTKEQKKDITLVILKTIYKLHSKGIIHGDISPNNLFIKLNSEKGDLKLTLFDFDMAEEFDSTSRNFLTQAKIDIVQMGKLIYGLIFSDELKGEEISHKEMKDKLDKIEEPSFLEAICKELLNVKITDGQLNLSLKEMIRRFEMTN